MRPITIRFCGFGGQGVILSAIVFGMAAVSRNMYAVQTQSYGSEARGGQCQAQLIISDRPINSPHTEENDILVALSKSALSRYLPSLRRGGTLVIDSLLETDFYRNGIRVIRVPATDEAMKLGNRIAANMVLLGFLQRSTGIVEREHLVGAITETVRKEFLDLNLSALDRGISLAEGVVLEVSAL